MVTNKERGRASLAAIGLVMAMIILVGGSQPVFAPDITERTCSIWGSTTPDWGGYLNIGASVWAKGRGFYGNSGCIIYLYLEKRGWFGEDTIYSTKAYPEFYQSEGGDIQVVLNRSFPIHKSNIPSGGYDVRWRILLELGNQGRTYEFTMTTDWQTIIVR